MQVTELCQYFSCDTFITLKVNVPKTFDFEPILAKALSSMGYDASTFQNSIAELNKARTRATESSHNDFPFKRVFEYIHQLEDVAFRLEDLDPFTGPLFECSVSNNSSGDLNFELTNIYYNLAVFFSDSAVRNISMQFDIEKFKKAYNCFIFSASIFGYVSKNQTLLGNDEVYSEVFQLLNKSMLAHAQEIAAYKAALDSKTFRLMAKLFAGAANMYRDCVRCYNDMSHASRGSVDTSWPVIFNARMKFMASLSEMAQMNHDVSVSKYSMGITRLRQVIDHCTECTSYLGAWLPTISSQLHKLMNFAQIRMAELKRDNDFIYHQNEVPTKELEIIEPVLLANITDFETMKSELGIQKSMPLFSKMLPSLLIEEISKFTEEKAKLLRFEEDKFQKAVEKSTGILNQLSMNLEDPLLSSLNYPHRIRKKCEHIFDLIKRLNIMDVSQKYSELLFRSIDGARLDQIIQALEREEFERTSSQEAKDIQFRQQLTRFFSEAHILRTKYKNLETSYIEQKKLFTDKEKNCINFLKNPESFTESALHEFHPSQFSLLHKATCDQLTLISEQKRRASEKLNHLRRSLNDFDIQDKIVEAKMFDRSTEDTINDCLSGFDRPCREFETEVDALITESNRFESLVNQLEHCWLANIPEQLKLAEELISRMSSCAPSIRNHFNTVIVLEKESVLFEENVVGFISKGQNLRSGDGKSTDAHAVRDQSTLMNRLKLCSQNNTNTSNASRNILLDKLEKYKN